MFLCNSGQSHFFEFANLKSDEISRNASPPQVVFIFYKQLFDSLKISQAQKEELVRYIYPLSFGLLTNETFCSVQVINSAGVKFGWAHTD